MKTFFKLSACVVVAVAYALLLVLQPASVAAFLLGVLVCNYFANLVHELGHLLAYYWLGLQWKRLVFSFFVFEAGRGFRFEPGRRIYEAACTCAYDPAVPVRRYDLALLSGGILGGLLGVGALLLSLPATGSCASFLMCFGVVSILNAAANLLLPFSPDRALMRQIRNGREKNQ